MSILMNFVITKASFAVIFNLKVYLYFQKKRNKKNNDSKKVFYYRNTNMYVEFSIC